MQKTKAGFEFFLGFSNLEHQAFVRVRVTFDERPVEGKSEVARQVGNAYAQAVFEGFFARSEK